MFSSFMLFPDPQLERPVQPLLHQDVDAAAALDTELRLYVPGQMQSIP